MSKVITRIALLVTLIFITQPLMAETCYWYIDQCTGLGPIYGAPVTYTVGTYGSFCATMIAQGDYSTCPGYYPPETPGFSCVRQYDGKTFEFNNGTLCYGSNVPPISSRPEVTNSCPVVKKGSIISAEKRTVSEIVPIVNTPFSLVYSSDKVAGYLNQNLYSIPVTGPSVDPNETTVSVTINVAGQITTQSYAVAPNITYNYVWNGLDGSGNPFYGTPPVSYTVTNTLSSGSPDYHSGYPLAPITSSIVGIPINTSYPGEVAPNRWTVEGLKV